MDISHALRIYSHTSPPGAEVIAFCGAGGKSTAMFQLAREIKPPVIVTTTTHLGAWQVGLADHHQIIETPEQIPGQDLKGVRLFTGPRTEADRYQGISPEVFHRLQSRAKHDQIPLLIEADGARQKPLKAPAAYEPAIPESVDAVVVVAGLSALGKPLSEQLVHRAEIFARLSGLKPGQTITPDSIVRMMLHPEGGLKNIPRSARRIALLTQAETAEAQAAGRSMAVELLSSYHAVLLASLKEKTIHAVHEPAAGIILAAGEARRFGQPKQLLKWRGKSFLATIIQTALDANLSPVIVVTGAEAEQVEAGIENPKVTMIRNLDWKNGQSSSIRAGLQALPAACGSAIFLLADQPQITPTLLNSLVEMHAHSLSPIVAPLVQMDRRANPVLFDRITFPDLLKLEGDVGGRAIFPKHRLQYLPWHDDSLLLDVDEPEDYARLKELE